MATLLFKHASIIDGSGAPAVTGDLRVADGRISAVGGDLGTTADEVIDCTGLTLAPGFIDMHSHSDWVLPQPNHGAVLAPLLEQGITTIVAGNCGSSPAPLLDQHRVSRIGRMLHDEDLDYHWSSMGSFLDALSQRGVALNLAQLVGHGSVRVAVMGGRPDRATPAETDAMADLVRQALDEGAAGFSTGLGYAPGVFAAPEELTALAKPLAERGGVYTSHARSYVAQPSRDDPDGAPSNLRALDETASIHRSHGVKVQHSHLIFVGDASWSSTDRVLEHLERLVDDGVDIACDAFPYVGGNTTLVVFMPPWSLTRLKETVDDPELRARARRGLDRAQASFGMCWEDTQITWVADRSKVRFEGMTIAEIATERGADPTETYLDLVGELGRETRIINWNYSGRDDEEGSLRKVMKHPRTCFETDTILTGNGFDNPASYGTFPRILGRYVRELGLLDLPDAVHRMTGMSAERMGLSDRGYLRHRYAADLVLFDAATIGDNTTRKAPDRPPTGIHMVVVNGHIVVRAGAFDVASRAGQVLRLSRSGVR
jgi:N-acyl-D-aspartate/D-glutamate deacylase